MIAGVLVGLCMLFSVLGARTTRAGSERDA
jgi:hypothetical protein